MPVVRPAAQQIELRRPVEMARGQVVDQRTPQHIAGRDRLLIIVLQLLVVRIVFQRLGQLGPRRLSFLIVGEQPGRERRALAIGVGRKAGRV